MTTVSYVAPALGALYRVESVRYASGLDEWDMPTGSGHSALHVRKYAITKETPKGKWIDVYGTPKFVRTDARKRFAHETEDAAMASFVVRRQRQIQILTAQLRRAKEELALATPAVPVSPRQLLAAVL